MPRMDWFLRRMISAMLKEPFLNTSRYNCGMKNGNFSFEDEEDHENAI